MGVLDLKKNSYIKELSRYMLFNTDVPAEAVSYLNSDKSLEDFNLYNDELFVYVFKTIIEKRSIKDSFVFVKDIDFTREMFKLVCFDVYDDNQVEIFKRLLDLYITNENTFVNYESVINAFDSKEVAYDLLKFLNDYGYTNSDNVKNISLIEELAIDSKQYFMDDRSLLSFMLYTLKKITPSFIALASEEELNKQIKLALNNARKNAGIYDITQSDLAEISDLINELNFSNENLENLLEKSKLEQKEIENKIELSKTKIEQQRIEQLKLFREKINNIISQFDSDFMDLVKKRNMEIDLEKESVISEMYAEAKKCISQLTILSNSITKNANEALKKIRSTETEATTSIESFIQNSDKVEKLFESIKDENKLLEILEKIDTIQIPAQKTDTGIIVPNIIVPNEERVIDAVNYYLDERIPFAKRFEELMRRKETLKEQKGYSFHEKFDDILALLIMNQNPYMIGPSGCGKSFLVDQISELLGIENVDIGYINEEYDIVGYKTADGRYSKTNFYDAYKYGSIAFGDEFDNGNAVASVKLNSFMTNKKNHSFIFPDGIRVNRHPNFRMIFAGNTTGHGATAEHNTRQKIDESVQQRQTPVYLDYDSGIERSILKEYPDWVKFIQAFRKATDSWAEDNDKEIAPGIITTRDIEQIKELLDEKVFSKSEMTDKIIKYKFIQTKDIDYLTELSDYITRNYNENEQSKSFVKQIRMINNGEKR